MVISQWPGITQPTELPHLAPHQANVFLAFVWQLAGRPAAAPANWRRSRPLMVVIDNYSVHMSDRVAWGRGRLEAADVYLVFLSAYSPELSRIETHWKATKYYDLSQHSFTRLGDLKTAVKTALVRRAINLRKHYESVN